MYKLASVLVMFGTMLVCTIIIIIKYIIGIIMSVGYVIRDNNWGGFAMNNQRCVQEIEMTAEGLGEMVSIFKQDY